MTRSQRATLRNVSRALGLLAQGAGLLLLFWCLLVLLAAFSR